MTHMGKESKKEVIYVYVGFPGNSVGKETTCSVGDQVRSLGQEDPLEEEMATHSSILAQKIPRSEEPGGLQSTESQESDVA